MSIAAPSALEPGGVETFVARARAAQRGFARVDQETADAAVRALAWSLYRPENAHAVAVLAVAETGLGNVADKIAKKRRKTFGALRDLLRGRSVGVIERDEAQGLVKYAKPVGVIAAVTPATSPGATPVSVAMMAVKGRNAIVVAPSPSGYRAGALTVALMRAELERIGLPADLVQVLPPPVTKAATAALMRACDLVVVTGSEDNVRRAYASGTPAIGAGAGNVAVIVDETADPDDAAAKIARSKSFDYGTSCSSENALVIVDAVYDNAIAALERAGGHLCDAAAKRRIAHRLWREGRLNRDLVARGPDVLADTFALPEARAARFLMVEEDGVGPEHPFSGEKLSLVLAVYRVRDFAEAKERVRAILEHQGRGHSCGIHTRKPDRGRQLAEELDVVRVLVNFAHTFGNGGDYDSGLGFSMSMGCGSWQKNSLSENLGYRHLLNITHLVVPIPEDRPSEAALFGPHWARIGYLAE